MLPLLLPLPLLPAKKLPPLLLLLLLCVLLLLMLATNNNNNTDNNREPRRLCDGTTASPLLSRGERRRHNDSGHVCTLGERSC